MTPFFFQLVTFPETSLSHWRATPNQISDAFSRSHDPITHARRARCLACGRERVGDGRSSGCCVSSVNGGYLESGRAVFGVRWVSI